MSGHYDRSQSVPIFQQNLTDACLSEQLKNMTWFDQIGERTKKQLLFGLLNKIRNNNSLLRLHQILEQIISRDYVYTISQHNFHQVCDTPSTSADRAIPINLSKMYTQDVISWFGALSGPFQVKFVVQILQNVQSFHILSVLTKLNALITKRSGEGADSGHFDVIGKLPNNIVKYLFGMLDKQSLVNSSAVCRLWHYKISEYLVDCKAMKFHKKYVISHFLPGDVYNQNYASFVQIPVNRGKKEIEMEVRNIYFQPYNFIPLFRCRERYVAGVGPGGKHVAITGKQNSLHFVKFGEKYEKTTTVFKGHVGSIRSIIVTPDAIFSASYDTTIRKWSIKNKKCIKIFIGHIKTVNDIKNCGEVIISGSSDCTCKVWNILSGKCLHTFSHRKPITKIAIMGDFIISGDRIGTLRTYSLRDFKIKKITHALIQTYAAHSLEITSLFLTEWFLVSSSKDCVVKCWSRSEYSLGEVSLLHHPAVVVAAVLIYLRVVTACYDGKIRIWNFLKSECIKVIRATAKCEPIRQLFVSEDSIIICTKYIIALLSFESVDFKYDQEEKIIKEEEKIEIDPVERVRPYSRIRSHRMHYIQSANSAILRNLSHISSSNVQFEDEQLPHSTFPVTHLPEPVRTRKSKSSFVSTIGRCSTSKSVQVPSQSKLEYISNIESIRSVDPIRCNLVLKTFSSETKFTNCL